MSGGQDEVQRQMTEGPPCAYQATGGADWQSNGGWGYQPINAAAMAMRLRVRARQLQSDANDLAALGMGRGKYPERSAEMAAWAKKMEEWAEGVETEVAAEAAEGSE